VDKLARVLDFPKEIVLDLPKVTLIGNMQALIENHRGVIEYSTDRIRISINSGEIEITGKDMSICNISRDEIHLDGSIGLIKYHC